MLAPANPSRSDQRKLGTTLAAILSGERRRLKITQRQLADMTGIGREAIAMTELGNRHLRASELVVIAAVLGVSLDGLASTAVEVSETRQ